MGLGGWFYSGINPNSLLARPRTRAFPASGSGSRIGRNGPRRTPWVSTDSFRAIVRHTTGTCAKQSRSSSHKNCAGGTYDPATRGPYQNNAEVKARSASLYPRVRRLPVGSHAIHSRHLWKISCDDPQHLCAAVCSSAAHRPRFLRPPFRGRGISADPSRSYAPVASGIVNATIDASLRAGSADLVPGAAEGSNRAYRPRGFRGALLPADGETSCRLPNRACLFAFCGCWRFFRQDRHGRLHSMAKSREENWHLMTNTLVSGPGRRARPASRRVQSTA